MLGPYSATASGFLAAEISKAGPFDNTLGYGLAAGLGVLVVVVLLINRVFAVD